MEHAERPIVVGDGSPVAEEVSQPSKPLYSAIVQSKSMLLSYELKVSMVDGSPTVEIPDDMVLPLMGGDSHRPFLADSASCSECSCNHKQNLDSR